MGLSSFHRCRHVEIVLLTLSTATLVGGFYCFPCSVG